MFVAIGVDASARGRAVLNDGPDVQPKIRRVLNVARDEGDVVVCCFRMCLDKEIVKLERYFDLEKKIVTLINIF